MALQQLAGLLRKLRSRGWNEIRFRIGQEVTNVRLLAYPPRLPLSKLEEVHAPLDILPNPAAVAGRVRESPFAAECISLAEQVTKHKFLLLGGQVETGPEIRWRRDYTSGLETGLGYFRRIPYLDAERAGDHKNIWELSRHQHLVLLAQAYLFSERPEFLEEIVNELQHWLAENPFQRGINWTSALEVAFRALSWIWIYHLVGDRFQAGFRRRFLNGLYWHGLHLNANLSYYFSPNTHLLGEAVALHALGRLFRQFPGAGQWEQTGAEVVRTELDRQVLADGCHFELSTYYHVYATDMFLFHAILRGPNGVFRERLTGMAEFLDAVAGDAGELPFIGDDDGGRFFHPYGRRNQFALATLGTCGIFLNRPEWIRGDGHLAEQAAWWLPDVYLERQEPAKRSAPVSKRFSSCGLVVMAAGDLQIIVDAGPFGPGSAGHTHADTLSVVLRQGREAILIDPGTYTYVGDPVWRNRFRGTAAHNTIRVDGQDQATPGGPFAWLSRPAPRIEQWESSLVRDVLVASCAYGGVRHERTVVFDKNGPWVVVLDRLEGAPAEHRIEQFWHFGVAVRQCGPSCFQAGAKALVAFAASTTPQLSEGGEFGWKSEALSVKTAAPIVCVARTAAFPAAFATMIDLSGRARQLTLRLTGNRQPWVLECSYDEGPAFNLDLP